MIASAERLGRPLSTLSASAIELGWEERLVDTRMLDEWRAIGRNVLAFHVMYDRVASVYLTAVTYTELVADRLFHRLEIRRGIGSKPTDVLPGDVALALPLWPHSAYPMPSVNWHLPVGVTLEEQEAWAA